MRAGLRQFPRKAADVLVPSVGDIFSLEQPQEIAKAKLRPYQVLSIPKKCNLARLTVIFYF